MYLHHFYFVPKNSNLKIAFASKFCHRPTCTKAFTYLQIELDKGNLESMGYTTEVADLHVKNAMSIEQGEAFVKKIKGISNSK